MPPLVVAVAGAYGVFFLYTALVLGWQGVGVGPRTAERRVRAGDGPSSGWSRPASRACGPSEFLAVMGLLIVVGTGLTFAVFGALLPALAVGAFAATYPAASYRGRRRQRRPAGGRGLAPHDRGDRPAHRVARALDPPGPVRGRAGRSRGDAARLRGRPPARGWSAPTSPAAWPCSRPGLADATADAACETLLVAHEVGRQRRPAPAGGPGRGPGGRRPRAARTPRPSRRGSGSPAASSCSSPSGWPCAGSSIGNARAAYGTPFGQLATVFAIGMVVACWLWSGRLLRLPEEERVFVD